VKVADYMRDVLVPANVAVSAIQRNGLPIDLAHLRATREAWEGEIRDMERMVEGEAARVGTPFKYSADHGVHPPYIAKFLFEGLGLDPAGPDGKSKKSPKTGRLSTDAESLAMHASVKVPRPGDHPVVSAILKIRSLAKGVGTYLDAFERSVRPDGRCHPKYNWALRTARLSAEDPPVHQIPEHSDQVVADGVKACIVPRVSPAPDRDSWDPRVHGSVGRWDIVGAEASVRAAMLTDHWGVRDPVAWEYLRQGKDIHSKTASLLYGVPEGTYKKGSRERDAVAKPIFFAKQFGAKWRLVQHQMWDDARVWIPDDEIRQMDDRFNAGYTGLVELYAIDKILLGERMDSEGLSWCDDPYGRRRAIQVPRAAVARFRNGRWNEEYIQDYALQKALNHAFHVAANTPTQSCNASDAAWMLALCHLGEYVELRVPPMWERGGIPFPEAADWQLDGGPGPGGKPFQAWMTNTVHDSGWFDCAPGHWLEAAAKVFWRRCQAVPLDWRLEADVPYRIELKVGPDQAHLRPYNSVAKIFGLEPVPER
jgi:hypothetical protein